MSLDALLADIRACRACADELLHEPRPVLRVSGRTRLLICGQAPGRRVHESGVPFDDPSGSRGTGWGRPRLSTARHRSPSAGHQSEGRDYPPPPRCLWRSQVKAALPQVELTLLVGGYSQVWSLKERAKANMTERSRLA